MSQQRSTFLEYSVLSLNYFLMIGDYKNKDLWNYWY